MRESGDNRLPEDIFRDKLYDLEINPPERSWQGIESRMQMHNTMRQKKMYLRMLPALLAFAVITGFWMHNAQNQNELVNTDEPVQQNQQPELPSLQPKANEVIADVYMPEANASNTITLTKTKTKTNKTILPIEKDILPITTPIPAENNMAQTLEDALLNQENVPLTEYEVPAVEKAVVPEIKKWEIGVSGGAMASYRVIGNSHSKDMKALRNELERPALTSNAGISASRWLNDNLRLEAGVELANLSTAFDNGGKVLKVQYDNSNSNNADNEGYRATYVSTSHNENFHANFRTESESIQKAEESNFMPSNFTYLGIPVKLSLHKGNVYGGGSLSYFYMLNGSAFIVYPEEYASYSSFELSRNMVMAGIHGGIEKPLPGIHENLIVYAEPEIRIALNSQLDHNMPDTRQNLGSYNLMNTTASKQYPVSAGIKAGLRWAL